jgi:hypothetical protein
VDVQRRYWQEFLDLKRDAFYIAAYHARTESIDRYISGFTAFASSSAVAGWILWRERVTFWGIIVDFSFVWMLIIMISQVINAVKEYLPYSKRLHSLSSLSNDFNSLVLIMENDWYKVSRGLLTEGEINELHMDMKRKKHEATAKSFPNTSLPPNKRLLARADADTQLYVDTYFFGGEDG